MNKIIYFVIWIFGCYYFLINNTYGQENINYSVFYDQEKFSKAEKLFFEKNYERALLIYRDLVPNSLNQEQQLLLVLRLIESDFYEKLNKGFLDSEYIRKIRLEIESFIDRLKTNVFYSAHFLGLAYEILGDTYWLINHKLNFKTGISYYEKALEYFEDSYYLLEAKTHYFLIFEKVLFFNEFRNDLLNKNYFINGLSIAKSNKDKALAFCGLAKSKIKNKSLESMVNNENELIIFDFEQARQLAKNEIFYSEILFQYIQFLEELFIENRKGVDVPFDFNSLVLLENLYEELLNLPGIQHKKYYESIVKSLSILKEPYLELNVPAIFLSGEKVVCQLKANFIDHVILSLYRIELNADLDFQNNNFKDWVNAINIKDKTPTLSFEAHIPNGLNQWGGTLNLNFPEPLEKGVYLLRANAHNYESQAVLLISEMALLMEINQDSFWVYAADAVTGKNIGGVDIKAYIKIAASINDEGILYKFSAKTDDQGLAYFKLPSMGYPLAYFIGASSPDLDGAYLVLDELDFKLKFDCEILVDRPLYYYGDSLQWALFLKGKGWENQPLFYDIYHVDGNIVKTGSLQLTEEGGASGEFFLSDNLAVGAYFFTIRDRYNHVLTDKNYLFYLEPFYNDQWSLHLDVLKEKQLLNNEYSHFLETEMIFLNGKIISNKGFGVSGMNLELSIYQYDINNRECLNPLACIHKEILLTTEYGQFHYEFMPLSCEKNQVYDFVFTLKSDRDVIIGMKTILVTPCEYTGKLETSVFMGSVGQVFDVLLKTKNFLNKPCGVRGSLSVLKVTSDPLFILEEKLDTDSLGSGSIQLILNEPGLYYLKWMQDRSENVALPLEIQIPFWIDADYVDDEFLYKEYCDFDVIAHSCENSILPVLFHMPSKKGQVIVSFTSDHLLNCSVFEVKSFLEKKDFIWESHWGKNVIMNVFWIKDCEVLTKRFILNCSEDNRNSVIAVEGLKPIYLPGEKSFFNIQLKDINKIFKKCQLNVVIKKKNKTVFSNVFQHSFNKKESNNILFVNSFLQKPYVLMLPSGEEFINSYQNNSFIDTCIFDFNKIQFFSYMGFQYLKELPLLWQSNLNLDEKNDIKFYFQFPECIDTWELVIAAKLDNDEILYFHYPLETQAPIDLDVSIPEYMIEEDVVLITAEVKNRMNFQQEVSLTFKVKNEFLNEIIFLSDHLDLSIPYTLQDVTYPTYPFSIILNQSDFEEKKIFNIPVIKNQHTLFENDNFFYTDYVLTFNPKIDKLNEISKLAFYPAFSLRDIVVGALDYIQDVDFDKAESISSYLLCAFLVKQWEDAQYLNIKNFLYDDNVQNFCLERLEKLQNDDGGFGWFLKSPSNLNSTAYVVWMLSQCKFLNNVDYANQILKKSVHYLKSNLCSDSISWNLKSIIFASLVKYYTVFLDEAVHPETLNFFGKIWEKRNLLSNDGLVFLMHAASELHLSEEALLLSYHIVQLFSKENFKNQCKITYIKERTLPLSLETTALTLMGLSELSKHELSIESILQFLACHRTSYYWVNYRLSALIVIAMIQALKNLPHESFNSQGTIKLNGQSIFDCKNDPLNRSLNSLKCILDQKDLVKCGSNFHVELTSHSLKNFCAFSVEHVSNFEKNKFMHYPCEVTRYYNRIYFQPTLLKGFYEISQRLSKGSVIYVGDIIEMMLVIKVDKPLFHVQFFETIPAGFKLLNQNHQKICFLDHVLPAAINDIQLGQNVFRSDTILLHKLNFTAVQKKDQFIVSFDVLNPGYWIIRYRLRAEYPGCFQVKSLKMSLYDEGIESIITPLEKLRVIDHYDSMLNNN